jgi:hypothetical protein
VYVPGGEGQQGIRESGGHMAIDGAAVSFGVGENRQYQLAVRTSIPPAVAHHGPCRAHTSQ